MREVELKAALSSGRRAARLAGGRVDDAVLQQPRRSSSRGSAAPRGERPRPTTAPAHSRRALNRSASAAPAGARVDRAIAEKRKAAHFPAAYGRSRGKWDTYAPAAINARIAEQKEDERMRSLPTSSTAPGLGASGAALSAIRRKRAAGKRASTAEGRRQGGTARLGGIAPSAAAAAAGRYPQHAQRGGGIEHSLLEQGDDVAPAPAHNRTPWETDVALDGGIFKLDPAQVDLTGLPSAVLPRRQLLRPGTAPRKRGEPFVFGPPALAPSASDATLPLGGRRPEKRRHVERTRPSSALPRTAAQTKGGAEWGGMDEDCPVDEAAHPADLNGLAQRALMRERWRQAEASRRQLHAWLQERDDAGDPDAHTKAAAELYTASLQQQTQAPGQTPIATSAAGLSSRELGWDEHEHHNTDELSSRIASAEHNWRHQFDSVEVASGRSSHAEHSTAHAAGRASRPASAPPLRDERGGVELPLYSQGDESIGRRSQRPERVLIARAPSERASPTGPADEPPLAPISWRHAVDDVGAREAARVVDVDTVGNRLPRMTRPASAKETERFYYGEGDGGALIVGPTGQPVATEEPPTVSGVVNLALPYGSTPGSFQGYKLEPWEAHTKRLSASTTSALPRSEAQRRLLHPPPTPMRGGGATVADLWAGTGSPAPAAQRPKNTVSHDAPQEASAGGVAEPWPAETSPLARSVAHDGEAATGRLLRSPDTPAESTATRVQSASSMTPVHHSLSNHELVPGAEAPVVTGTSVGSRDTVDTAPSVSGWKFGDPSTPLQQPGGRRLTRPKSAQQLHSRRRSVEDALAAVRERRLSAKSSKTPPRSRRRSITEQSKPSGALTTPQRDRSQREIDPKLALLEAGWGRRHKPVTVTEVRAPRGPAELQDKETERERARKAAAEAEAEQRRRDRELEEISMRRKREAADRAREAVERRLMEAEEWVQARARWYGSHNSNMYHGAFGAWHTQRVFISSTFRDFHGERDVLTRVVFPALNERCRKRRVRVVPVDLRWGLTSEDTSDSGLGALEHCMLEIDRCRPFFVVLAGERYGWIPPSYKVSNRAAFRWVEKAEPGHSITDMEVQHGVLHKPYTPVHAFMYERKPDFLTTIEDRAQRRIFSFDYPGDRDKLALRDNMRQQLRENRYVRVRQYDCEFGGNDDEGKPVVTNLDRFEQMVLEDLWNAIKAEFPKPPEAASALDVERGFHWDFVEDRARTLVGRRDMIDTLHRFAVSDASHHSLPLVVVGEPGTGKSSIIAAFAHEYARDHPRDFVLVHVVGASPSSSDVYEMLLRLCRELGAYYHIPVLREARNRGRLGADSSHNDDDWANGRGVDYQTLQEEWQRVLEVAGRLALDERSRVVLVVEAANQLHPFHGALSMEWFPQTLPEGVRAVVSVTPDSQSFGSLASRSPTPHILDVPELTMSERRAIVVQHLATYRKRVTEQQLEAILSKTDSHKPLYLLTCCEELRLQAQYGETGAGVDDKIAELPGEVPALLDFVLARVERDLGQWARSMAVQPDADATTPKRPMRRMSSSSALIRTPTASPRGSPSLSIRDSPGAASPAGDNAPNSGKADPRHRPALTPPSRSETPKPVTFQRGGSDQTLQIKSTQEKALSRSGSDRALPSSSDQPLFALHLRKQDSVGSRLRKMKRRFHSMKSIGRAVTTALTIRKLVGGASRRSLLGPDDDSASTPPPTDRTDVSSISTSDGYTRWDSHSGTAAGSALVRDALCLLTCARHGLRETELLELLAPKSLSRLPAAVWTRLYASLELYIRPTGGEEGMLGLFHDQMRAAVERRYLGGGSSGAARIVNSLLAQFFKEKADPDGDGRWRGTSLRAYQDIVYYQLRGVQLEGLRQTLGSPRFIQVRASQGAESLEHLLAEYAEASESLQSLRYSAIKSQLHALGSTRARELQWLSEWTDFVSANCGALVRFPVQAVQLALCQPTHSAPCIAAHRVLSARLRRLTDQLRQERPSSMPADFMLTGATRAPADSVGNAAGRALTARAPHLAHLKIESPSSGPVAQRTPGMSGPVAAAQQSETAVAQEFYFEWLNKPDRGRLQASFSGFSSGVSCMCVSRDGRMFGLGFRDSSVLLINTTTGETLREMLGAHTQAVACLAFSPDDKLLLSGSHDHTAEVWDTRTGTRVASLLGHERAVTCAVWIVNSDKRTVGPAPHAGRRRTVMIHADKAVRGSSGVASLARNASLMGRQMFFEHELREVVTASLDASIRVWREHPLGGALQATSLDLSAGSAASLGSRGAPLHSYDLVWIKDWLQSPVLCMTYSPEAQILIGGRSDGRCSVWDTHGVSLGLVEMEGFRARPFSPITSIAMSKDSKTLATGCLDSSVSIWFSSAKDTEVDTPWSLHAFSGSSSGHSGTVTALAFSPDLRGSRLASTALDKRVIVWDVEGGVPLILLTGHVESVFGCVFTSDGAALASCGDDACVKVWDVADVNRAAAAAVRDHPERRISEDFGVRGRISRGMMIRVARYLLSPKDVRLAKSPAEREAALEEQKELRALMPKATDEGAHSDVVTAAAVTLDGQLVATGSKDKEIKVWRSQLPRANDDKEQSFTQGSGDAATLTKLKRQAIATLLGHRSAISSVAWVPGRGYVAPARVSVTPHFTPRHQHDRIVNRWLATGDEFGLVLLWDGESFEHLRTFVPRSLNASILSMDAVYLRPTDHNSTLVCGTKDGHVLLFDPMSGEPKERQPAERHTPSTRISIVRVTCGSAGIVATSSDGVLMSWAIPSLKRLPDGHVPGMHAPASTMGASVVSSKFHIGGRPPAGPSVSAAACGRPTAATADGQALKYSVGAVISETPPQRGKMFQWGRALLRRPEDDSGAVWRLRQMSWASSKRKRGSPAGSPQRHWSRISPGADARTGENERRRPSMSSNASKGGGKSGSVGDADSSDESDSRSVIDPAHDKDKSRPLPARRHSVVTLEHAREIAMAADEAKQSQLKGMTPDQARRYSLASASDEPDAAAAAAAAAAAEEQRFLEESGSIGPESSAAHTPTSEVGPDGSGDAAMVSSEARGKRRRDPRKLGKKRSWKRVRNAKNVRHRLDGRRHSDASLNELKKSLVESASRASSSPQPESSPRVFDFETESMLTIDEVEARSASREELEGPGAVRPFEPRVCAIDVDAAGRFAVVATDNGLVSVAPLTESSLAPPPPPRSPEGSIASSPRSIGAAMSAISVNGSFRVPRRIHPAKVSPMAPLGGSFRSSVSAADTDEGDAPAFAVRGSFLAATMPTTVCVIHVPKPDNTGEDVASALGAGQASSDDERKTPEVGEVECEDVSSLLVVVGLESGHVLFLRPQDPQSQAERTLAEEATADAHSDVTSTGPSRMDELAAPTAEMTRPRAFSLLFPNGTRAEAVVLHSGLKGAHSDHIVVEDALEELGIAIPPRFRRAAAAAPTRAPQEFFVKDGEDGNDANDRVFQEPAKALICVFGGAGGLFELLVPDLRRVISEGVVEAAAARDALIIDGGTRAGIMRMVGAGLHRRAKEGLIPVRALGVSPGGVVAFPSKRGGAPLDSAADAQSSAATGHDEELRQVEAQRRGREGSLASVVSQDLLAVYGNGDTPLEEHHHRFLFAPSDEWGGETGTLLSVAMVIRDRVPSVAVVANGGLITKLELLNAVRLKITVVLVVGSGRLADQVATIAESRAKFVEQLAAARELDGVGDAREPNMAEVTEQWLLSEPDIAATLLEDEALLEIVESGSFRYLSISTPPSEVRALLFQLLDEDAKMLAAHAEDREGDIIHEGDEEDDEATALS